MLRITAFCGVFLLAPHAAATTPSDHIMLPDMEGEEACHSVSLIQTRILGPDGQLVGADSSSAVTLTAESNHGYNSSSANAVPAERGSSNNGTVATILLQKNMDTPPKWKFWLLFLPQDSVNKYMIFCCSTWLLWSLLGFLVAHCCFSGEPDTLLPLKDPVEAFERSHFACLKTPKICCCACFCPAVQWAETMHLAGFVRFPFAILMFNAAALMNVAFFFGTIAMGAFTGLTLISYRQNLREKLGVKSWTCENCFFDFLYVCCCPCLAITQEAQVVRYAYQCQTPGESGRKSGKSDKFPPAYEAAPPAEYPQVVPQSHRTLVTVPIAPNATPLTISSVPVTMTSPPPSPSRPVTMPATTITMSAPVTQLPTPGAPSLPPLPANRVTSLS